MSCLILIIDFLISQRQNSNGGRLCFLKSSLLSSALGLSSLSDSHLLYLKVSHILNLKLSYILNL